MPSMTYPDPCPVPDRLATARIYLALTRVALADGKTTEAIGYLDAATTLLGGDVLADVPEVGEVPC